MKKSILVILVSLAAVMTAGCGTVEPWQKGDLALEPMQVDPGPCSQFETSIQVYREGAVGANGGKSGGGCGCS